MAGTSCTFEVVASQLHDPQALDEAVGPVRAQLIEAGGAEHAATPDAPHCWVVGTGGSENRLLHKMAERRRTAPTEPVVLLAHREHNSLPAALETLARVHQDGFRGRVVICGQPDDQQRLVEAVLDQQVVHRLRSCRIGLIGTPSEWLVASTPPADVVAASWGPTLVDVAMPEVIASAHEIPVHLGRDVARRFRSAELDGSHQLPPPASLDRAAHVHPVLEAVADEHKLDAVTVRCFDFLSDLNTSGCVALAQLNDDGFIAGCEGDIPSALVMVWVRFMLNQPSWIANPAAIDTATNTIDLAHCTIAPSMVESLSLSTHFESGIGVGIHGEFAPGPVTLLRIGGADLRRLWVSDAMVRPSEVSHSRCRTQASVELCDRQAEELLDRPLGNHLVMISGHHRSRLETWWRFAIA